MTAAIDLVGFLGRLHPALAHVAPPLALWAAVEAFCARSEDAPGARRVPALLLLATIFGLAAAASGWANLEHEGHELDPVQRLHRAVGIALALSLPLSLVLSLAGRVQAALRAPGRVATFASAALGVLALQLGGTLVFGEGHLVAALRMHPPASGEREPARRTPGPPDRPETPPSLSARGPGATGGSGAAGAPAGAAAAEAPGRGAEPAPPPPGPAEGVAAPPTTPDTTPGATPEAPQAEPPRTEPASSAAPPPGAEPAPHDTPREERTSPTLPADLEPLLARLRERGLRAQRAYLGAATVEVNASFLGDAFGDDDLALLDGLEDAVETLALSTTAVTDAAGARLARLTALDSLRLDRTAFGDAGLFALAGSPVRVLNLYGSSVTDAGLPALRELPRLERVFLWDTAVSDAGVAELAAARPTLEIVR